MGLSPSSWGSLDPARAFVRSHGLTFTNLWDNTDAVWQHYGSPYTSRFMLLDRHGNQVMDKPISFSVDAAQKMLNDLLASP